MSGSKTLYGRKKAEIILSDAISECSKHLNDSAIALLYSPTACQFAKLIEGKLKAADGKEISLSSVFEARIFNKDFELRWLNALNGDGHAVLISEVDISKTFDLDCNLEYLETLPQQYVLWGEGMSKPVNYMNGWSRLGAARVGAMDIPITGIASKEQRVVLKVVEYLQEVDCHGNVAVVEERLVHLESISTK